jgi:hypothetical protein
MPSRVRRRPVVLDHDHARPRTAPAPASPAVEARLTELIGPALFALGDEYRRLGLRARVLSLPVMVGVVRALIWRQVPSVCELLRALERERLLWVPPRRVSQQALSQRLRCLPAALFADLFHALLPRLLARAAARTRPLPPVVARARRHYAHVWAVDGSTLGEVFAKVGLLRGAGPAPAGGVREAVLDLSSKLPVQLWLEADPHANDKRFLDRLKACLPAGVLLVLDRGFYAFPFFDWLTETERGFVTRARSLTALTVERVLLDTPTLRDRVARLGKYRSNPCRHPVRLVEVQVGGKWRAYLTNALDPRVLPAADVVDLYGRRWRIEEAFLLTKRLLGLSYLWSGAFNAIALQVWATWLLYAVLVDLTDAVAQELDQPLDALSVEMAYRGLYHFTVAFQQGAATDPVAYLASQPSLGVVKRRRKHRERTPLDTTHQEANL